MLPYKSDFTRSPYACSENSLRQSQSRNAWSAVVDVIDPASFRIGGMLGRLLSTLEHLFLLPIVFVVTMPMKNFMLVMFDLRLPFIGARKKCSFPFL